ncbi:MAG: TonB-dependent receptor [Alistipes sp.]
MSRAQHIVLFILLATVGTTAEAQPNPIEELPADSIVRSLNIEQVEITAQRPLRQIGVQRTVLDSTVLRDNITSSLADALSAGAPVFIKSYGRATLATASFRGTAPSHTQVMWNGMKLNSPMLGQVDFSLIPAYFIDDAALYYGASSVGIAGGGLGGAVSLATRPVQEKGFGLRYIQGAGSFCTFDEFAHFTYGAGRWGSSTRVLLSTSRNDFKFTNYRIKEFTTDEQGQIIGSHYPVQRNKNGGFRDLHLLQEFDYTTVGGDRLTLAAWYMDSHRGLPMLSVDMNKEKEKKNTQDERTLRAVASWERMRGGLKLTARGGYTYTDLLYLYLADPEGNGNFREMIHSQSYVHTAFAEAQAEYCIGERWMFSASVAMHQNYVRSGDAAAIGNAQIGGVDTLVSYRQARFELSGFVAAKWRPIPRLGLAINLRGELYGERTTPLIPAFFADFILSKRGAIILKASAARNYRYPTLNDLYFRPGGNPALRPESGWTCDGGAEFTTRPLRGSMTAFYSDIDDWILWINNPKLGICTPINIQRVESYGVETKLSADLPLGGTWRAFFDGNFAWTRSINRGKPFSPADRSVGKQLVYIPEFSGAFTARVAWRAWTASYKWSWYSERYTMSSNDLGVVGRVKPYLMNDLALERRFACTWGTISLKGCINNLFNEEYESVLARPMARQNYSLFLSITPRFGRR